MLEPVGTVTLDRVRPIYESFDGWQEEIGALTCFEDLPAAARAYVAFLEETLGIAVPIISVGPERDQTIVRRDQEVGHSS